MQKYKKTLKKVYWEWWWLQMVKNYRFVHTKISQYDIAGKDTFRRNEKKVHMFRRSWMWLRIRTAFLMGLVNALNFDGIKKYYFKLIYRQSIYSFIIIMYSFFLIYAFFLLFRYFSSQICTLAATLLWLFHFIL